MTLAPPLYATSLILFLTDDGTQIVDEAKRALHDAICAVRNLVVDDRVVYGGGAADISCSLAVGKAADEVRLDFLRLACDSYPHRAT